MLRQLVAAVGSPLVPLLTRLLGDEELSGRIAHVVEYPRVTFDVSEVTCRK